MTGENIMYKILSWLIIGLFIASCNPFVNKELRKTKRCNKKLNYLTRQCPQLLQPKIITKTVVIEIPLIDIDTSLLLNDDVSGVDSILANYRDQIDSLLARKLGTEIKWYVKERSCILDTLLFEEGGIKVAVYQEGNEIRVIIKKPPERIEKEVKIKVPVVMPIKLSTLDKVMDFLRPFWWWLVLAGIILLIIAFFKKQIRNLF